LTATILDARDAAEAVVLDPRGNRPVSVQHVTNGVQPILNEPSEAVRVVDALRYVLLSKDLVDRSFPARSARRGAAIGPAACGRRPKSRTRGLKKTELPKNLTAG
jgi:sirohydrochlorin ferrochelatase